MTRDLMIPCPTCNGDGFVSHEDRHTETNTASCKTCGGRGVVPAATGQTPETSAAQDGGLHASFRRAPKASEPTVVETDPSGSGRALFNTGVPKTGSFHSGD